LISLQTHFHRIFLQTYGPPVVAKDFLAVSQRLSSVCWWRQAACWSHK